MMTKTENLKFYFFVLPVLIIALLACNLSRFTQQGNATTSKNSSSANKASDTSDSISTICNNAYFPVGPSVVRKYRVTYPKGMLSDREYTESFSDLTDDTFAVNTDFGNVKAHINWKCSPDGLLATQYDNTVNMVKSGASARVDTMESNGVSLPPEDRWKPGETWHAEYRVTETLNGPDGKQMGGGEGTVTQDGAIIGSESVTVPAGTFEAMKTELKTTVDITVTMKGMSIPMKVPIDTTAYFAKGTGMIKSVTKTGAGGDATSELLSISK